MTILLIEDNKLFSGLIEESLDEVDVYVVETLAAAKKWLALFRADLILVDLGLPDSSGLNTLKELMFTRIPKMVISASHECPLEAAQLGAVDYLHKADSKSMITRIRFHIKRLARKPRFEPAIFEEIKGYLACPSERELVGA